MLIYKNYSIFFWIVFTFILCLIQPIWYLQLKNLNLKKSVLLNENDSKIDQTFLVKGLIQKNFNFEYKNKTENENYSDNRKLWIFANNFQAIIDFLAWKKQLKLEPEKTLIRSLINIFDKKSRRQIEYSSMFFSYISCYDTMLE